MAGALSVYATRYSWGPAMIVGAPSPAYAPTPLPTGVARAVEVERAGARVRAWLLEPGSALRGTLLVLHGIGDDKRSLLSTARGHAARGFRTLVVDSRGHGESSGRYLTYGVEESRDLRALVDVLEAESLLRRPLIVLGTSYGAATAVQYAALDERVDSTIAVAPFHSLVEVVPAYVEWMLGPLEALVSAELLTDVIEASGRRAHFDPAAASPFLAAGRIRAPVRIIHSRDDERIPVAHARAIAARLVDGELVEIDGASHNETGSADGVSATIAAWLDEVSPPR
ncbi:MAG: hypothetical protein SangKO_001410 [Sandaracinaceae bacterium]